MCDCSARRIKRGLGFIQPSTDKIIQNTSKDINGSDSDKDLIRKLRTVLLLGGTESGKSTVLKQMRLKYGLAFGEGEGNRHELKQFRTIIRGNIWTIVGQLLKGIHKIDGLQIPESMENGLKDALANNPVFELENGADEDLLISPESANSLKDLLTDFWRARSVQSIINEHCREITILDSVFYWFPDALGRVLRHGYVPTEKDILHSRVCTVKVQEYDFHQPRYILRVVDVGGAKTQRNKWLQLFSNANAVIFVAALNGYCQALEEYPELTRLQDSVALFSSIINNQYLSRIPIILFLNKRDIFKKIIKIIPLEAYFPAFNSSSNNGEEGSANNNTATTSSSVDISASYSKKTLRAAEYIRDMFLESNANPDRDIRTHVTCATDKNQLQKIIEDISTFWIKESFGKYGLI